MPTYKVQNISYGEDTNNYSYDFDTTKFSGVVSNTERILHGLEKAFNYLPEDKHFPFEKPITYDDAKQLSSDVNVACVRAILNKFSKLPAGASVNKYKDIILGTTMQSQSIETLLKQLNKLEELFEKHADDDFKNKVKVSIVGYN